MERTSVWIGTKRAAQFPTLNRDVEVDVAVVGGGITGLTAAKLLSEQGKRVAVLEAHDVGAGTTGNSTGNLYATVSHGLHAVREKWGTDTLRTVVASRIAAVDFIERTARDEEIECAFARRDWHLYTTADGKDRNDTIDQELQAQRDAGLEPQRADDLRLPFRIDRGIKLRNQAQFDPFAYCQGLAEALRGRGCAIYRGTPATAIDAEAGTVKTANGNVRCAHVVLATHTPKGIFAVQGEMRAAIELGLACRLEDDRCPEGIFWGLGRSMHSLRSFEAGGRKYLVVIGDKYPTGHEANMRRHVDELAAFARAHFAVESVDYTWAAQHFHSADELPFIGRSRSNENVHLATGFATDGLVYGTLAAMIIADAILGRDNPWAATYDARRIDPAKAAKGTAKESIQVVKHLAKDWLTDANVERLRSIEPGDGALIDTDRGKLAVYRDEQGRIAALSPVCTHLGCMVHWNNAQKTWDCPCHGSRFDTEGTVLEGPALQPLARPAPD